MTQEQKDERRKVLYVGTALSGAIVHARELAKECKHWQGREAEQGYAYRTAGLPVGVSMFAPLRAPHHTTQLAAVEGRLKGHMWRPGELALAHGGVLYLDQVHEFRADVLHAVARAWTKGYVHYASRTGEDVQGDGAHEMNHLYVPTYFTLAMSTTQCLCGWRGAEAQTACRCSERSLERHVERIRVLSEGAERIELPARAPRVVEEAP